MRQNINVLLKTWQNDLANLKNWKPFIENSNNMQDVYKIFEKNNPSGESNALTVFDNMIDDMICNKKLNPIITELLVEN